MTITYDRKANALYIRFKTTVVNNTARDDSGRLIIDYAKDGAVVGIEVLNASEQISTPLGIEYSEI